MEIRLSSEREQEELQVRQQNRTFAWEHLRTSSLVQAVHAAKEMGWAEKKVQVRMEIIGEDVEEYVVEPFESGCGCPNVLKYADYFTPAES